MKVRLHLGQTPISRLFTLDVTQKYQLFIFRIKKRESAMYIDFTMIQMNQFLHGSNTTEKLIAEGFT